MGLRRALTDPGIDPCPRVARVARVRHPRGTCSGVLTIASAIPRGLESRACAPARAHGSSSVRRVVVSVPASAGDLIPRGACGTSPPVFGRRPEPPLRRSSERRTHPYLSPAHSRCPTRRSAERDRRRALARRDVHLLARASTSMPPRLPREDGDTVSALRCPAQTRSTAARRCRAGKREDRSSTLRRHRE